MRVPLRWLSEWIALPDSVDALALRLTSGGLEIENIERTGPDLSGLRVGYVVERKQHPDADRLSLCRVDVGEGEPLDIVCGAPNVASGQKVAVALHGATLPDGSKIKRSKIRGVTSNGMICSARELGLSDEHAGILVLDAAAPVGAPLSRVLAVGETVLDVEITPNRGDSVSMLGIAREVRTQFGGELTLPPCAPPEAGSAPGVAIAIDDRDGCSRYVARVVRGVRVGPSPAWLAERLVAAGYRAINNVVDVTNLVMHEFGQPLHAFDLGRVKGAIRVRAAQAGEKLVTLDGAEREFARGDLVIADESGAIAVAGVMGGAATEVSHATTDVLIESARFEPSRVRRTARRLGLHSDSSYRFERGVDAQGQRRAADRAALLLQQLAGGEVAPGAVEARGDEVLPPAAIRLDPARVNRLLGTALDADECAALLGRVEVASEREVDGALRCTPPSYRADLRLVADLVEEIARVYGYDRIPATLPAAALAGATEPPRRATTEAVRSSLVASGLSETMSFPCVPETDADALRLAPEDARRARLRLANPIQTGQPFLRSELVASVLRTLQTNLARQAEQVRLFELSRVFRPSAPGALPEEPIHAVAALTATGVPRLWETRDIPIFYQAKGVAERLLADLGCAAQFQAGDVEPFLHPGAAGAFFVAGRSVAVLGELHPEVARRFEIELPTALLRVDVDALAALPKQAARFDEVSKHPRVQRDLAVLLDSGVPAGAVAEAIRKTAGRLLVSVTTFDRYTGKGVPAGKVSVAYRLVFQRLDRTLTDAEVNPVVERVVSALAADFGGVLR